MENHSCQWNKCCIQQWHSSRVVTVAPRTILNQARAAKYVQIKLFFKIYIWHHLTYLYVDKYWVGRQSDVVSSGETCVCQIFTPGRYYRLCIDADGTTFPQIPGDTGVTVTCPMLPISAFAQSAHWKMNGIFTAALSRSGVHDTGGLRTHLHHSLWSCCRGRGWGMQLGTTCFLLSLLLRTIRMYIYILHYKYHRKLIRYIKIIIALSITTQLETSLVDNDVNQHERIVLWLLYTVIVVVSFLSKFQADIVFSCVTCTSGLACSNTSQASRVWTWLRAHFGCQ